MIKIGKNKFFKHQIKTIDFGIRKGSYADLSEMGTGKTLSTLTVLYYHFKKDANFKAMVIAPKTIIMSGWVRDCQQFFPDMKIIPVLGSSKKKLEAFNEEGNIYVSNFETFHQDFNFEGAGFNALVCDEAVKLKNHKAKWTQNITKFSELVEYKIILSGLLTPNNLQEIYGAFNVIEEGILGWSFWQFRSRYFTPDPHSFENRKYIAKDGAMDEITGLLSDSIIRHTKKDCLDLPEKMHSERHVEMPKKQARYYRKMEAEMMLELEDREIPAVNKASVLSKLAQISSGFIYDEDKAIHKFESAKVDELEHLLQNELAGEQVLIFTNFKAEVKLFKEIYPDSSFIHGGQNDTKQLENIDRFLDGTNRLCFANMSATKYGLTLTNTANVIYYSLNYSLDDYAQSQDRVHRIGQTRTCNYIYLLSTCGKTTVDHKILNALKDKKSLNELVTTMIEDKQGR